MRLEDLIEALMRHDALFARQWVADARRAKLEWQSLAEPAGLDDAARIVAAGIVEMLAERDGVRPPSWTAAIGPAKDPILLVRAAATMPRLKRLCEDEGPAPLRRRGVLAPPDFLTAA
jgi:hypothetical protein